VLHKVGPSLAAIPGKPDIVHSIILAIPRRGRMQVPASAFGRMGAS
jgi:hypothetical protein